MYFFGLYLTVQSSLDTGPLVTDWSLKGPLPLSAATEFDDETGTETIFSGALMGSVSGGECELLSVDGAKELTKS